MVGIVGSASDKGFMASAFLASGDVGLQGGTPGFVQRVRVVEFLEIGFVERSGLGFDLHESSFSYDIFFFTFTFIHLHYSFFVN